MTGIYPVFKKRKGNRTFFNTLETILGLKILPFTCGRSAIVAGLSAFGLSRMDEILVSPYLGQCVLSAISRTAFPTMTPSNRTKAVLVYHQFGYPQDIARIESTAKRKGWIVLNDCANTIFTQVKGRFLAEWGDFTIVSLSKLYPCAMGGGFYSKHPDVYEKVFAWHKKLSRVQTDRAEDAIKKLIAINSGAFGTEAIFEINSLYGYLPDLVAFPRKAYSALPSSKLQIEKDITHRRKVWSIIKEMLPDRVPAYKDEEIVPFAVPISGDALELERLSAYIKEKFFMDAPVLHFDFARNMLKPDYRKSLVIGCHEGWSEENVIRICEMIKKGAQ